MTVKTTKIADFVISEEVVRCGVVAGNMVVSASTLCDNHNYRHSIGSYEIYTNRCTWHRDLISTSPSSGQFIVNANQLIYAFDSYLVHANPFNGDVIKEFNLKKTIWGPLLLSGNNIICSTSSGAVYHYNLESHDCVAITILYSNFHEAIAYNDFIFAITQSKPGFWKKAKAVVNSINLRTFDKRVFMNLGESAAFTKLFTNNNGIYLSKHGNISKLNHLGKIVWSYTVSPRVYQDTDVHSCNDDNLLLSSGSSLCLLEDSTGNEIWNHDLQLDGKTIASAMLLANDWVIFSTCGGGFMMLEDPENFIGFYNPTTKDLHLLQTIHETPRICLLNLGDDVLAYAVVRKLDTSVKRVTQFLTLRLSEIHKR